MNQPDQKNDTYVLAAINDIFFYAKLRDAARSSGYVLERVKTQADMTARATARHPAGLILNMNDEGLDAFQALAALKADERLKTIPVLAFANHEEVETWRRAKELGVTKIVSRNEFSARTKDLVEELVSGQGT
jgi:PleD family two-component response regulator